MYASIPLSHHPNPRSNVFIIKTVFVIIVVRLPFRSRVNRFFLTRTIRLQREKQYRIKNIDRPDIGD